MAKLESVEYESFEQIKQIDENGTEFWFARDLSSVLTLLKMGKLFEGNQTGNVSL